MVHYNMVQIDYNIRQDKQVYLVAVYTILVKRASIIVCYKLSKQPKKSFVESCHQLSPVKTYNRLFEKPSVSSAYVCEH